jgi:hypothetical protein
MQAEFVLAISALSHDSAVKAAGPQFRSILDEIERDARNASLGITRCRAPRPGNPWKNCVLRLQEADGCWTKHHPGSWVVIQSSCRETPVTEVY